MQYEYIAIEGNIGAGKTSLTKLIGQETGRDVLLENHTTNPFLKPFYQNKTMAFQMEMSFLLDRYIQFKNLDKMAPLVSDFFYLKTLVFAKNNLFDNEYQLFENFFNELKINIRQPDLLFYLYSDNNRLIKNIKKRNRDIEKNMLKEYLNEIEHQYENVLDMENGLRIIICDITSIDFVKYKKDLYKILSIFNTEYPIGKTKLIIE